ncbi:MAG: hypothetical protein OCD76_24410 [Reichenbachiella sp.]
MKKKFTFSDSDKTIIKSAIEDLELESSGEIVVYFARNSDSYFEACWKLAAILGVAGLGLIGSMSHLWLLPEDFSLFHGCLYLIGVVAIGFTLLYLVPQLRLVFINETVKTHRVLTKARDIFLQEEAFNTIDRTGILIYISELEHKVQVIGDKGIHAKIKDGDWNEVVDLVINGIKNNIPAQGIADAISKCKTLLLDNGFIVREDDTNELPDDIRIEE